MRRADLLVELVLRDLRLRYRRSALGAAWSQLGALATLGVLWFLFTRVVPLGIPDYAVFVFAALLAWTWFSAALLAGTGSVVEARDLLRRPGFPVGLLPAVAVTTHLVHYLLALPVLLAAVAVGTGRVPPTAVALPAVLAVQFLLTLGPAYLLAAANVRFRDVAHLVSVSLLPLFYASPVFYGAAQVPSRFHLFYDLNPLAQLFAAYRAVLLEGRWPAWDALAAVAGAGAALAAVGGWAFAAAAHRFPEEL